MRPTRRTAACYATAYLLAGWLASALHDHSHHHRGQETGAARHSCCGHAHHGCGSSHSANETHGDGPHDQDPHHESSCVVCDFLGQPPLLTEPVSLAEAAERVWPVAAPRPPAFEPVVLDAPRSRGPPAA